MPPAVRALRGATTLDHDTSDQMTERVGELVEQLLERNNLAHDDLISILFTATDDLHAMFPATAARAAGLGDIPLICARELDVAGGARLCVRMLLHVTTVLARDELVHVYLHGAVGLRDDLPG